jgi:hypothetical protein
MFDPVTPFPVSITSGGKKTVELRWPTDQQWAQRARETKVRRRVLGGGRTQRERTTSTEADAALFAEIHVSGGEAFDELEKSAAIAKLDRTEVVEVHRKGDLYRISLRVAKGHTVHHRLKIPTQRQMFAYENQAIRVVDHRRTQEVQMFLEPAETLWGQISDGVEGYAEGAAVPINHKDAAVTELLALLAEQEDDTDPEA